MREMGTSSPQSLHAVLGSKNANFIDDLKTHVLTSPEDYYGEWLCGLDAHVARRDDTRYTPLVALMCNDPKVEQYVELFIKRTFLRQADDLSKKRPTDSEAEVWLGQNHASYGLLVTPRFNDRDCDWENDKSEIRHFKYPYFTISHVLQTGLVIPGKNKRMNFRDVEHYLQFFEHSLVRSAGSKHQDAVAQRYVEYVGKAKEPGAVPLMLPEVRFSRVKCHQFRLDFMVVEPSMMLRVGFELSPWSTHGRLGGVPNLVSRQPQRRADQLDESEVVSRRLLIPGRDRSEPLQVVKEDFDQVALAVERAVEWACPFALRLRVDDRLHSAFLDRRAEVVRVVAGVTEEGVPAGMREELVRHDHLVALAGSQRDVDRPRPRVDERVELGRKTSSRAAQSVA